MRKLFLNASYASPGTTSMRHDEFTTFEDPVFGTITLDQWAEDFWTLRHIPSFCPFPESDANSFCGAEPQHRSLIEEWTTSIPQLSRISRISNVHDALRHRRVFEVAIARIEAQLITDDQRAAFRAFLEAESQVADLVLSAAVTYYHSLDEAERCDPLEILSENQLVHFTDGIDRTNIERICAFDGIFVSRSGSAEAPSLVFRFEPYWDFEHGFGIVWRDGKIWHCGRHDEINEMLEVDD